MVIIACASKITENKDCGHDAKNLLRSWKERSRWGSRNNSCEQSANLPTNGAITYYRKIFGMTGGLIVERWHVVG